MKPVLVCLLCFGLVCDCMAANPWEGRYSLYQQDAINPEFDNYVTITCQFASACRVKQVQMVAGEALVLRTGSDPDPIPSEGTLLDDPVILQNIRLSVTMAVDIKEPRVAVDLLKRIDAASQISQCRRSPETGIIMCHLAVPIVADRSGSKTDWLLLLPDKSSLGDRCLNGLCPIPFYKK